MLKMKSRVIESPSRSWDREGGVTGGGVADELEAVFVTTPENLTHCSCPSERKGKTKKITLLTALHRMTDEFSRRHQIRS
jgi:hypothetical protein